VATTPGAIYQAGRGSSLFEDVRARRVGDVITVVLQESTNAAQSASTSTSKDSSVNLANPTLFGNPFSFGSSLLGDSRRNLQTDIGGSRSFSGEGGSQQSNRLTGNITATVVEVLPNGYLRIRGEKLISINKGDEYIRLTGVVRPVDIQADNSVLSTMVANAEIAYGGNGVLADASEMGWLSRFFNSKWWPF
jgi:flagellar L-ring protein precursor FlgH